jgi:SAM-dependent methyltransferase
MMDHQAWAIRTAPRAPGLAEMFWALKDRPPQQPDLSYAAYRAVVERYGEPALLIGAASGGLLLNLLRDGIEVEAVEPSPAMRGFLLRLALEHRLRLTLYGVPMEQMELGRQYSAILVPYGTMMLLTDRKRVLRALGAIYRHLRPGGALAFNVDLPAALLGGSDALAGAQPSEAVRLQTTDGESLQAERRLLSLDPVDQIYAEQRVYRLYRDEQLVRQEYRTVRERWYSRHEMAMMLAWSGFGDIKVAGVGPDFAHPVSPEQISMLMFTARR